MKKSKAIFFSLLAVVLIASVNLTAFAGTAPAPTSPVSDALAQSSNAPYFVGAVIAVLVFVGVALYCKFKGNK